MKLSRHIPSTLLTTTLLLTGFLLIACDNGDGGESAILLTESQKADLSTTLSSAEKRSEYPVREERIQEEAPYVLGDSDIISAIYDGGGTLLGYTRTVNTGVGCHDGNCSAIKFVLVFDSALEYLTVFYPSDSTGGEFYKGLENNTTDAVLFTEADWEMLLEILADPPAILLSVTDRLDMADAETGATFPAYQGAVVPGAAYTTYSVLTYIWHTETILSEDVLGEIE